MIVRVASGGRWSKPATVVAAIAVLGAGFLLLTFGLVLLATVVALGTGVAAATIVRRSLKGERFDSPRFQMSSDRDRIMLDPALEVSPRVEALKASPPPPTPPAQQ